MGFLIHIPLMAFAVLAYIAAALVSGGGAEAPLMTFTLASGAPVSLSLGGSIVLVSLLLLYVEILKATRASAVSILDHAASLAVFLAALMLFLFWPAAGSASFLMLLTINAIDVIAGFTVTISTARRDIGGLDRLD